MGEALSNTEEIKGFYVVSVVMVFQGPVTSGCCNSFDLLASLKGPLGMIGSLNLGFLGKWKIYMSFLGLKQMRH